MTMNKALLGCACCQTMGGGVLVCRRFLGVLEGTESRRQHGKRKGGVIFPCESHITYLLAGGWGTLFPLEQGVFVDGVLVLRHVIFRVGAAHTPCQGDYILVIETKRQLSRPKEDSACKMSNLRQSRQ